MSFATKTVVAASTRSFCSVIITRVDADSPAVVSVGRPIRDKGAYVVKMTDEMYGWGYAGCTIVSDCMPKKDLRGVLAALRARGLQIEGESALRIDADGRGRLIAAMRDAGLKVRVRNANEDGNEQRLLVTGDAGAFFDGCDERQQAFLSRLGLKDGATGVFEVV